MEAAYCSKCLRVVEERLGYRSRTGAVLCGPCYSKVQQASGEGLLSVLLERIRPQRRPRASGQTTWIPGPGADLSVRRDYSSRLQRH